MRDGPAIDVPTDLKEKALLVHERLCAAYGCPIAYFHDLDPLSELVSSLLSHRTRNADSGRAFKELRRRFPDWAAVRDAPVAEVEAAVSACTWPEQKAPRVRQVLREITQRRGGELSLDFLRGLEPRAAQGWLRELPGVGPKTAAAVLAFSSLRMPALPVDCHHHRVAQRLGLIGPKVSVAAAHALLAAQLPADFDAQRLYDNHEVMMLHGQRCCYHQGPACARCPVLDLCPTGQVRLAGPDPARRSSGARFPGGAGPAPAQERVEPEPARPGQHEQDRDGEVEQGHLFARDRVAGVGHEGRRRHGARDEEGGRPRRQAQREEDPAAEFGEGRHPPEERRGGEPEPLRALDDH